MATTTTMTCLGGGGGGSQGWGLAGDGDTAWRSSWRERMDECAALNEARDLEDVLRSE